MINDQKRLKAMNKAALALAKPDAAKNISKEILELANSFELMNKRFETQPVLKTKPPYGRNRGYW